MTGLLHLIGALADRHPSAIETIGAGLALFGASFIVAWPVWARIGRRT
jgi:hypothetical protein